MRRSVAAPLFRTECVRNRLPTEGRCLSPGSEACPRDSNAVDHSADRLRTESRGLGLFRIRVIVLGLAPEARFVHRAAGSPPAIRRETFFRARELLLLTCPRKFPTAVGAMVARGCGPALSRRRAFRETQRSGRPTGRATSTHALSRDQRNAGMTFAANSSRWVSAQRGGSPGGSVHE
jgi:hypothetical protein